MTDAQKPSRWKRFVWFLERAAGTNASASGGPSAEESRALGEAALDRGTWNTQT